MSTILGDLLDPLEFAGFLGLPSPFTASGSPPVALGGGTSPWASDPRLLSLYRHPILAGHPAAADAMMAHAHKVRVPSGTHYRSGTLDSGGLLMMMDGRAKLLHHPVRLDADGRPTRHERSVLLSWQGPGTWVGQEGVLRALLTETSANAGVGTGEPPLGGLTQLAEAISLRIKEVRNNLSTSLSAAEADALSAEHRDLHTRQEHLSTVLALMDEDQRGIETVVLGSPADLSGAELLLIPFEAFVAAAEEHPILREWLIQLAFMTRIGTSYVEDQLARHPLLCNLLDDRRALLCAMGAFRLCDQITVVDGQSQPWMPARKAGRRVALILEGEARSFLPGRRKADPPRIVGTFGPGELVGFEDLASGEDIVDSDGSRFDTIRHLQSVSSKPPPKEPHRSTALYLSEGTRLIEWDWEAMRRLLHADPGAWLGLLRFVERGHHGAKHERAKVFAVLGDTPGVGVGTVALGLAVSMARRPENQTRPSANPLDPTPVVLIDFDGERSWKTRWQPLGFQRIDIPLPGATDPLTGANLPALELSLLVPGPAGGPQLPANLMIGWTSDVEMTPILVSQAVWGEGVRRVIVAGGSPKDPWWGHLREAMNQAEIQVIWLTNKPGAHYTATDEVPQHLIRVDRMDASYRKEAAIRARATPEVWNDPALQPAPSPAVLTTGHMRLADDAAGVRQLLSCELEALWSTACRPGLASSMERLTRIAEGESIGLALAGGGILGCCHMALLQELELARIPIDYIAGSSIGAVVGALYAAGGTHLLDRLLEDNAPRGYEDKGLRAIIHTFRTSPFLRACTTSAAVDTSLLGEIIDNLCKEVHNGELMPLECTSIPFYPVSANLNSQAAFTSLRATVGYGVRAASGMPPVLPGLWRNGERLLDGALISNVPSHLTRIHGADFLIASNVMSPPMQRDVGRMARRIYNATVGRVEDVFNGIFLLAWKSGDDQGRLVANHLVDARSTGVWLADWWRAWRLRDRCREQLAKNGVAARISVQWVDRSAWMPNQVSRVDVNADP